MTEIWLDSEEDVCHHDQLPTSQADSTSISTRIAQFYAMFLLLWQSLFKVSDSRMSVLFLYFALLFSLILTLIPSPNLHSLVVYLPKNTAAAKDRLLIRSQNMLAALVATLCILLMFAR